MNNLYNLNKATEQVVFNLTKRGIVDVPRDINVTLLLDYSGSMATQYEDGSVARVLRRLLSISNTIDDDGILELIPFDHRAMSFGPIDVKSFDSVETIIRDVRTQCGRMGGTSFSPAIYKALDVLGAVPTPESAKGGFISRLFGKASPTSLYTVEGKQLLVLISDGDDTDPSRFLATVADIEKMPNVYLQCICVGYTSGLMYNAAKDSDSVGYSSLQDFSDTDDALIESIINEELIEKFKKVGN